MYLARARHVGTIATVRDCPNFKDHSYFSVVATDGKLETINFSAFIDFGIPRTYFDTLLLYTFIL